MTTRAEDRVKPSTDSADLDTELRWRAVVERRFRGDFVYAVRSTGIYCLSDCPARRPEREHVSFFAAPADAEAAGYRACKRCRPDEQERQVAKLETILADLEVDVDTPSLGDLAARAHMSIPRLKRLFVRELGLEPGPYLKQRRAERLKAQLKAGAEVTGALYDAGYGSSRALYERSDELLGMTPGSYRKGGDGMHITYRTFETVVGPALIAATERGVCALRFGEGLEADLKAEFPAAELREAASELEPFVQAVHAYLAGERVLELPLDLSPTAFQAKVWSALRAIPYGETRSYAEVAAAIGDVRAVRAVASACARNPVALAVPCHRVVRSDGSLSGYRWGLERKAKLLETETNARQQKLG